MRFCELQEETGSGVEMRESPQGDVEALKVEELVKGNRSGLQVESGAGYWVQEEIQVSCQSWGGEPTQPRGTTKRVSCGNRWSASRRDINETG